MKCNTPYQKINAMGFAKEYPCGRCLACRINRAEEWATRLLLELEDRRQHGDFVTLTFDDSECCPLLPLALSKRVLQNYFKRLRKAGNRLKYFACGEYGERFGRAHYHAIIIRPADTIPNYQKHWGMGNVEVRSVGRESARYVTGYLTKGTEIPEGRRLWPPFQLQSQGIGAQWAREHKYEIAKELSWIPKYLLEKAQIERPEPEEPTPLQRNFTSVQQLTQRGRNQTAKIASKET